MRHIFVLLIVVCFLACSGQESKMNGVSFVAAPNPITIENVQPVVEVGANWAAVMPFGFIKSLDSPQLSFNLEQQWWGEREDGTQKTIELLNEKNIQVMLKPQIWVWHGEFTGDIDMQTESQWKAFEKSYEDFILTYARLAEVSKVPILCIGTELHTFVQKRSEYWSLLITKIKSIYKGKLTYAENWDQIARVPFWNQMDYIGIDAYFPLSDQKNPTIEDLQNGWISHKKNIIALSNSNSKPILFTEYGYRSVDYTAKAPWDSQHKENQVNLKAQEEALRVLYQEFWNEPWFAGGFLWKWFHNHNVSGGHENNRFTVQNKPAEQLIKSFYEKK